ncbi:hypothetical protein [Pseudomonas sp. NPDC090208]|uniref:hypothetical protein n=1 Tax=Pseudomonas sp. NPDC090208 TaxID=3364478 RepID=UPI00382BF8C9
MTALASDFALPQFIVSQPVSDRIQSGKARLMILPFRPQPSVCPSLLEQFGVEAVADEDLLSSARVAFSMGLIQPPIAPIRIGYAFELQRAFVPEKCHKFGTGIVQKMGITRFNDITTRHWRQCGYSSREDFNEYWHQAAADLGDVSNPWCWLIEFIYKG